MKYYLTVLLCLLLCGCSARQQTVPVESAPQETTDVLSVAMYDPNHPMELRYPGQVQGYSLSQRKVHGLLALGSDILILSGQDNTTLTLLTGDTLQVSTVRTLGFHLGQENPSIQIHNDCLSFFDPRLSETVVLDHELQEVRRIAVPQEVSGTPILSSDTRTLYYCTPWAVVAWNLDSGIRRTVRELQHDSQELTALLWQDQILACTVRDKGLSKTLLLKADNGSELHTLPEGARLITDDTGYFFSGEDGFQDLLIFSRDGAEKELLLPQDPFEDIYYLSENSAAVTVRSEKDGICLDYYTLESGILSASLTLDSLQKPKQIVSCADHAVYILVYDPAADCDTVYRWDVPAQVSYTSDPVSHTFAYRDEADPDPEALEQCRQYARSIGQKYGISVRIWEDACQVQPWDYQFAPESLAPVLQKELKLLDQRLSRFPAEILEQTTGHFTGLTICLVRKITGSDSADSLATATGIQFFENNHAYVVITTGRHSEQALYHELFHVMETHILTNSSALDHWEALNPADFSYGTGEVPEVYLQGQTRAFVDSYSTESVKEDRARVLENAMLKDRETVFRSEYMQRKLTALCQGIREAYGLKKLEETFPWEQYLSTPLSPVT